VNAAGHHCPLMRTTYTRARAYRCGSECTATRSTAPPGVPLSNPFAFAEARLSIDGDSAPAGPSSLSSNKDTCFGRQSIPRESGLGVHLCLCTSFHLMNWRNTVTNRIWKTRILIKQLKKMEEAKEDGTRRRRKQVAWEC